MNPRFYDRLAAAVSIGLLLTLAAGSYYLAEIAQRFVLPGLVQDTTDIADAFGENVLLLRLNERGEPAFRMSADRMEHFRRSDTTRYTRPTMVSLDPAQPRVTVTALRGQSVRESQETILEGSVQLDRPGTAIDPPHADPYRIRQGVFRPRACGDRSSGGGHTRPVNLDRYRHGIQ